MTDGTKAKLRWAARNEITEHHIYLRVAGRTRDPANRAVLERIADDEKQHSERLEQRLGESVAPARFRLWFYTTLAAVLGAQFTLKLMERGEDLAVRLYRSIAEEIPDMVDLIDDEQRHEEELLAMVEERYLKYVGSFVLGLNDALVELTGALAGLTLALRDTRLIAAVGLITGIAASMAMAASEYLSTQEEQDKGAITAAATTGIAYFVTVMLLILPYLLIENSFVALAVTMGIAVLIILVFTFYTAIARGTSFPRKFRQMAAISLGVAALNFVVGFVIKGVFDV